MTEVKECTKCQKSKPLDEFCVDRSRGDGRHTQCKLCMRVYRRHYYHQNKVVIRANNRRTYQENKDTARQYAKTYRQENAAQLRKNRYDRYRTPRGRYDMYKAAAKRRGIPWCLTLEQFSCFWQQTCVYCGKVVDYIGLDRVDNSCGYTKDNCVSCCKTCNRMKGNLTVDAWLTHIRMIANVNLIKISS